MRRTTMALLVLAAALGAVVAAPTAAAHTTYGIDLNGDWDCNDPGETVLVIPTTTHRHVCAV